VRRLLARLEAWVGALSGSRYNPLHHSGAIVVLLLVVLLVTGLYLLIFYRVSAPYESTRAITEQVWLGRWVRSLHRFATDAGMVAILVHALKMLVQGRSWGPRALAWLTGVGLLGLFLVCGWTGYVMVWDVQGQVLAMEGARILDVLPILSEPLTRTFVGERPIQSAFFFVNLFLHVALPLGLGVVLWLHVARLSRPRLLPPREVGWAVVGLLTVLSVAWPVSMGPPADLLKLPAEGPYDAFLSFWLPVTARLSPAGAWLLLGAAVAPLLLVPLRSRPRPAARPPPSAVNERLCTGCEQCASDCPYEAIAMVPRPDGRAGLVARVDESLCVSCGICAGSCAPMVVGPPGRSGRDQLADVKAFIRAHRPGAQEVVAIACSNGAGGIAAMGRFAGAPVYPVRCAGSLHTSVIEYLVRSGAGGVLVVSCPVHDCRNREGARWLEERMYGKREAELQERVDRRRVRWLEAGEAERSLVLREIRGFRDSLPVAGGIAEAEIDLLALCERGVGEAVP
jgi:ferredoxin/coenzyme F420-reducing hydrogenase delta subunit